MAESNKIQRCFIAVELQRSVKESILDLCQQLSHHNIRWLPSQNYHLTLRFLGNLTETDIQYLVRHMTETFEGIRGFNTAFESVKLLPNANYPRVMAIILEPKREFAQLLHQINHLLTPLTIQNVKHGFLPHITIARLQKPLTESLNVNPFPRQKIAIDNVTLFSSNTLPSGAIYNVLKRIDLNNGSSD